MRYTYENKKLSVEPTEWDRNSPREILQYAVGGLLYSPATNTKIADAIINRKHPEYKSICLDLEDAIGDDVVKVGEKCIHKTLKKIYSAIESGKIKESEVPLIFVRVREPSQMTRLHNICGSRAFSLVTGFNIPKFDKSNCDDYLEELSKVQSSVERTIYIMPIIESKNVMYKQRRIDQLIYLNDKLALYSDNVLNIRVGATDFCNLFGIRRSIHDTIYDMRVIADCFADIINVFARNYVCAGPVWEYFQSEGIEGEWSDGLKRELAQDKLNGFLGKTCIHPSQLKYIAESNIVSYENYQDAISILGMSDGVTGVKKGYGDNKMNEVKTHMHWAKKIIGMAKVYGVAAKEEN